jgi:hypothetical protein
MSDSVRKIYRSKSQKEWKRNKGEILLICMNPEKDGQISYFVKSEQGESISISFQG